ncbi:hypothetical protein CBM2586_B10322 [Cupriavidus phytorum]|uniref:Uncharacterized protein n=1 Tax=Cupriavidus taiwanensis TaxID=164546 RepID=A0A975XC35_9BURK|nr:hypothetical protein CBM2586_B10322 [Cupriavidus taiwanensis]
MRCATITGAPVRVVAFQTRSGDASLIFPTVAALLAVLLDFARCTHTMPRRQPIELADLEKKQNADGKTDGRAGPGRDAGRL